MREEFKNPSNQYRPIPFWSWNDKLDPEELKEQIRELKKSGAGGYFMHARSGLNTVYLSEDWFHCIETGIRMAEEEGMDAWIYDEEGWPSGFAGGIVPGMSEAYQSKFMTMERGLTEKEKFDGIIAAYRLKPGGKSYERMDPAADETLLSGEEKLTVYRHVNPFYIDTLSKQTVDVFLSCTHEEYFKRFGADFGSHMKGFFTDEPRLACNNFGELAWSDELPELFAGRYGYDILDHLPALYQNTDGYQRYRYDFWSLVSELFTESYMKNIYDWCEKHGCKSTGHIMMEESVFSQMTSTAGVMPFYEYLHVPGIDWLRRMISSPVIGKQVGSVACQLGKKQVITESYALCGWNVSFEELRWIAEWQFVNGVNQICQHLMAYTIKGCRKRDYPPSHFTQQTWWKESHLFQDYLARLCVGLSEGDQTADVLLIHPMKSGYITYDGTRSEEIRLVDEELTKTCEYLSGQHISYHFGDETLIRKYGSVEGGRFKVGRIPYRAVILPHMYAIEGNTLELLSEFTSLGGMVLSTGRFPDYTNGSSVLLESVKNVTKHIKLEKVRETLAGQALVTLSITESKGGCEIADISYLQRECDQGTILFLVNSSQEKAYDGIVRVFEKSGSVTAMIAENGEMNPLSYEVKDGDTWFRLHFEPMGSHMLLLEPAKAPSLQLPTVKVRTLKLDAGWELEHMDLNSMTLDYCTCRIDGGEVSGPVPVIKVQDLLLELRRPCKVELGFTFDVEMDLLKNRTFDLVIEDAHLYEVSVNGASVSTENLSWWKDKAFRRVPVKQHVKNGRNTVLLKTEFKQPQKVYDVLFGENVYETEKNKITYDIEIESIYLLGDFGVKSQSDFQEIAKGAMQTNGPFVVTDAPEKFENGDFTRSGLLFFAGTLELCQTFSYEKGEEERVIMDLGAQYAPLVKYFVNDKLVKDSLWAPYEADITSAVQEGENKVRAVVYASNRNLLGPHHHIDGECYNVGPESFTGRWSWVERTSEADATDIDDRTKNYWTDTYSFVKFGFGK